MLLYMDPLACINTTSTAGKWEGYLQYDTSRLPPTHIHINYIVLHRPFYMSWHCCKANLELLNSNFYIIIYRR